MPTEARKRLFYVSEPWWSEELSLLTRAGTKRVTRLGIQQVYLEFARPYFDPATFVHDRNVQTESAPAEVSAVCQETLDGALITHGELHDLFLNRPVDCTGVRLQSADTAITYGLSVISRKENEAIAKRLRKRIDDLILDGALLKFAAAHPPIAVSGVVSMAADIRDRAQNRILRIAACVSLLFAAFLGFFLWNRQRNLDTEKRLNERLALDREISRLGSYEWFPLDDRIEWSAETEAIFGAHTRDGRHTFEEWKERVHPTDVESIAAAIANAKANRQPTVDLTYRIIRADGTVAWIHSRSKYSYDSQGKFSHGTGVVMDISALKQGEMAQQILGGLLQVCSACRRVHNDDDQWYSMEGYLRLHNGPKVSHGMCPDCSKQWLSEVPQNGSHEK